MDASIIEKVYRYTQSKSSPLKVWKQHLMGELCELNDCKLLLSGDKVNMLVIGPKDTIEGIVVVYEWLKVQLELMAGVGWVESSKSMDPLKFRDAFFRYATVEISRRMWDIKRTREASNSNITGLVLLTEAAVDKFITNKYPRISAGRRQRKSYNSEGASAGRAAGRRVDVGQTKISGT